MGNRGRRVGGVALLVLAVMSGGCGDDDGGGPAAGGGGGDGFFSEELCDLLTEADFEAIGTLEEVEAEATDISATCTYNLTPVGSVLVFYFGEELADHSVYEDFIASGDYEPIEGLGADVAQFETGTLVAFTDSVRMELHALGGEPEAERELFETLLTRLLELEE